MPPSCAKEPLDPADGSRPEGCEPQSENHHPPGRRELAVEKHRVLPGFTNSANFVQWARRICHRCELCVSQRKSVWSSTTSSRTFWISGIFAPVPIKLNRQGAKDAKGRKWQLGNSASGRSGMRIGPGSGHDAKIADTSCGPSFSTPLDSWRPWCLGGSSISV